MLAPIKINSTQLKRT